MSYTIIDGRALAKDYLGPVRHQKSYSAYWRKNRSRNEATELALALRSLRKVAGHIGKNVRPIYWLGMSVSDGGSIVLDPDDLKGTAPIPFHKMDVLVGHVVREAFKDTEWSQWVASQVKRQAPVQSDYANEYLDSLLASAEDIYIDSVLQQSIWSLYLGIYWRHLASDVGQRDPSLPPAPSILATIWRNMIFFQSTPDHLHPYYLPVLDELSRYSSTIKEIATLPTVPERRSKRVDVYLAMWDIVCSTILDWEIFDPVKNGVNLPDDSGQRGEADQAGDNTKQDVNDQQEQEKKRIGLERDVAEQVNSILDEGRTDLSANIGRLVDDPDAKEIATIFSRGAAECHVLADTEQIKRLRKIFEKHELLWKRGRKKQIRRALDYGEVDARRLHRTPIDGKIFKRKHIRRKDMSWNIAIVADASASMNRKGYLGTSWEVAERTFVALAEATKGFSSRLEVYAYYEQNGQCEVVSLLKGGKFFTVCPVGQTPSGQAILASALMMKKDRAKRLIIHITDGEVNFGINVAHAVRYCYRNSIDLITIGCGCSSETRQALKKQYPQGLYLMEHIYDLPEGLERLFHEKLLNQGFQVDYPD